jgi:hypothetical protein
MFIIRCNPWFAKKKVYCVDESSALLYMNSNMDKRFNQLSWWWLVVHCKYYFKTWLTFSVYSFIWGWKANDNFTFTLYGSKSHLWNLDANQGSWSKIISWVIHSQLLEGLKCESKWKTAEEGRVGAHSLAHNTWGVKGRVGAPGWD